MPSYGIRKACETCVIVSSLVGVVILFYGLELFCKIKEKIN